MGQALGQYYLKDKLTDSGADGSIMIVLATDAPLSDRNLTRLARRALAGLARTGAAFSDGSGIMCWLSPPLKVCAGRQNGAAR